MAAGAQDQINVTAEDQQMINKFARLHQNFVSLQDEIKSLLNDVQNLNEASDEIMLLGDEDSVPIKLGTTFVHVAQDDAQSRMDELKETAASNAEEKTNEKTIIEAEMKRLKGILYSKFGDRINLEDD